MSQPKATLEEMADACQDEADRITLSLEEHTRRYPHHPPDNAGYRKAHVLNSAALIFRVMGTFEDRSRKFITDLMAEHRRG